MARYVYVLYGVLAYAVFLATFLYLVAFLADVPWVRTTIDRGPPGSPGLALIIDLSLIGLFGIQHSVMARPSFKKAWTRLVPPPIERSTYIVFASATLIVLFAFWRPLPADIWQIENPGIRGIVWTTFALGWCVVLLSTFLINHFELFGLQQILQNWRGRTAARPRLHTPLLYKLVRHPLYAGFLVAFWAAPTMSAGHLVFALAMSAYVLIAIRFEERDLVETFGNQYAEYRNRVGMLIPRISGNVER